MKRLLVVLIFLLATNADPQSKGRSNDAQSCRISPRELGRSAIHILSVEALSTQPTDGTYADEGRGQGEFETVKLLEVLKSPIRWTPGHKFRVHPFPGKCTERENLAPEHLTVGKRYYLVYTYSLEKQPADDADLIGLTRCGVLTYTPEVRSQLLEAASLHRHRTASENRVR